MSLKQFITHLFVEFHHLLPRFTVGFLIPSVDKTLMSCLSVLQDIARVSYHFVRGNDAQKFVSVVVNFMGKVNIILAYSSEFMLLGFLNQIIDSILAAVLS